MGNPFSTKKKTEVGTSVQRMVEDSMLPDTAKTSVLGTLLSQDDDESLADNLIEAMGQSLGLRARRMYDWAKTNYTYGMPTAYLGNVTQGEATVKEQIEANLGHAVTFDYFYYAPLNHVHWGWIQMIQTYGYNPVTNELETTSAFLGTPVYLKSMTAVYTQQTYDESAYTSLEEWYNPAVPGQTPSTDSSVASIAPIVAKAATTGFIVDTAATTDTLELVVQYQNYLTAEGDVSTTRVTHETKLVITVTGINPDVRYYHVKYRWLDNTGVTRIGYWLYEDESGFYPQIDAIHQDEYSQLGAFYPWIHFRDDKVNLNGPGKAGTADHNSSKKACQYLGLDYEGLTDSIHENPDIDDVEQAMLIMGVSAETTHQTGLRYLFEFFGQLSTAVVDEAGTTYPATSSSAIKLKPLKSDNAVVMKDREFAMVLYYNRIEKRLLAGNIGEVGTYASVMGTQDTEAVITKRDGLGAIFTALEEVGSYNSYFYRKQVTTATYEEVRVYGLELQYFIWKPGTNQEKSFTAGFGADALIIPLDHNIVKTFSLSKREDLYAMSMHMVFNSRITIKTKWYQQGWFRLVLIVAAIVWMVYTGDFTQFTSLLASGNYAALALVVLKEVALAYVFQLGLNYLAEIIGAEWALILAVAVVAYAGFQSFKAGSIKGAPWAEEMLQLGNGLAKASESETQRMLGKLSDEASKLESQMDLADKEIKRVEALLESSTLIDPMEFVAYQPFIILGEEPSAYYTRSVSAGNIGMRSIDAISAYAQNALRLPTLAETEGGFYAAG